jgi:hypothetical protein
MVGAFDGGARGLHITLLKVSAMQFLPPKLLKVGGFVLMNERRLGPCLGRGGVDGRPGDYYAGLRLEVDLRFDRR